MPYPNEHAARMESPEKYQRFRRRNIAPGIDVIFGITGEGKTEVQAYRFAKEKYTPAQAKAWLEKHKLEPKMFEQAKSE